ncbi:MAG TPA: RNase adapter RapZ, partial [Pseudomonadota bacterium]|nr:RNase adapter RapZ [Pseudomonadota bacterium]
SGQVLALTLLSFGFKYGLPVEADMVLDVRFLPNPYFIPALSNQTGLEPEVSDYVLSQPDAQTFVAKAEALIEFYLPRAQREGKSYVTVAIGCTGGRHRSVAVVADLFNRLGARYQITVRHRELGRGREP